MGFYPIPRGYNRIDVTELSQDQIQEVVKTADIFGRSVIIQDLLIAGYRGGSKIEREFQLLAAELYVKSPDDLRQDFLMHLVGTKSLLKTFFNAALANCVLHENKEASNTGSSGLTRDELKREGALVEALVKCLE